MVDQIKGQKQPKMASSQKGETHVAYLGETGFPSGFAAMQRQILISKGLIEAGCNVTVISFKGTHKSERSFPPSGTLEGIHYRYTSGSIYKPKGFLKRNLQKMKGRLNEWTFLRQLKKQKQLDYALVSTMHFGPLLWYSIMLKILKIPAALSLVELNAAIVSRKQLKTRINDLLVDRFAVRLFDGVLPISDHLLKHTQQYAPGKPILKAPIICDFAEFEVPATEKDVIRLVYCGAPRYFQLIRFVLDAFDCVQLSGQKVSLDFILGGGTKAEIDRVNAAVADHAKKDHIRLFRNVSRAELIQLYRNATALLIPLRPTLQDAARFPHKLGEYLASGRAVITTAYGEINRYNFIDKQTALVASEFKAEVFAEQMQWAIDHPDEALKVGEAGRRMGIDHFSHLRLGRDIKNFLETLKKGEYKK